MNEGVAVQSPRPLTYRSWYDVKLGMQARIQGGGGRDPPPALTTIFFFSTNFLGICDYVKRAMSKGGGVLVNVQSGCIFFNFSEGG